MPACRWRSRRAFKLPVSARMNSDDLARKTAQSGMLMPILVTKLFAPQSVKQAVSRRSLVEQINHGLARKLTLVCAPAGFGQSSLLGEWAAG